MKTADQILHSLLYEILSFYDYEIANCRPLGCDAI
jgi:hypothetical protein